MNAVKVRMKDGEGKYVWGLLIDNEFVPCQRMLEMFNDENKVLAGGEIEIIKKRDSHLNDALEGYEKSFLIELLEYAKEWEKTRFEKGLITLDTGNCNLSAIDKLISLMK